MTREDADNHASHLKDTLKDALIVSCQPVPGGAMDDSQFVVAFALRLWLPVHPDFVSSRHAM